MNSAHGFHDVEQRGAGWYGLGVTQNALCVEHIPFGHGATVHAELAHQHGLVFAVDFHVGTGGQIRRPTRGGLGSFVVHDRPEGAGVTDTFEGFRVDVVDGVVTGANGLHLGNGQRCMRDSEPRKSGQNGKLVCAFHACNIN